MIKQETPATPAQPLDTKTVLDDYNSDLNLMITNNG